MLSTIPKSRAIISYKDAFGMEPPKNRLDLIGSFCKTVIIAEIAALNYRLKPKDSKYQDVSLQTQQKELHYFCGSNDFIFNKYAKYLQPHLTNTTDFSFVFTRQTCLYAIEEIINSDMRVVDGFNMR